MIFTREKTLITGISSSYNRTILTESGENFEEDLMIIMDVSP